MMLRPSPRTQTIFVPCETFAVRVLMTPSETMTPLEQLVVRALHSGLRSIEELDDWFAMGRRPLIRLALDLLAQSKVTFNFGTGEIRLVPSMVKAIEANKLGQVEGLERTSVPVMLMRDLLTGTVLAQRAIPATRRGKRVRPELSPNSNATIPAEDLMRAVRGHVRRPRALGERPLYVLDVTIDRSYGGAGKGRLRDLELEVRPQLDTATNRLSILIESPDDLPWRTRVALEKKLTELANTETQLDVFKNLRDNAVMREELSESGLYAQVAELQSLAARLTSAQAGTEATWQRNLQRAAAAVEGMIVEQGSVPIRAGFIFDRQRQVEAIREMIGSARRQVIITCPFVHSPAVSQFREVIEAIVANGRQLFFLLGRDDSLEIDTAAANWLHSLKSANEDLVFFSRQSSRCNARFVAVDGNDVLITSYQFLSKMPGQLIEFGVRLTATDTQQVEGLLRPALPVVADLLQVAKEIYPEHRDAVFIAEWPRGTGKPNGDASSNAQLPVLPSSDNLDEQSYETQRLALWKRDWERYAARLASTAAQLAATYHLVRNADHRQLLYRALRDSERRVILVCETLSVQPLDRLFIDTLEECLRRGVRVSFVYGQSDTEAAAKLDSVAASLLGSFEHIAASAPGQRIVAGNMLVCDDWALITSFNFLGRSASYVGPDRHRAQTELGILIDGAGLVGRLCVDLGRAIPKLAKLCEETQPAFPHTGQQLRTELVPAKRRLSQLLNQVAAAPAGEEESALAMQRRVGGSLTTWFLEAPDVATAFAELEELAAIDAPFIDQAIAACLTRRDAPDQMRAPWFSRLIESRWWTRRDLEGVVLLFGAAPQLQGSSIPSPHVALLTARSTAGTATVDTFEVSALRSSDELSATAVAALAIPAVLFETTPPSEALRVVNTKIAAPLQNWSHHVLDLRERYPDGLRASDFESLSKVRMVHVRGEQARNELIMELRRCVGLKLNFTIGKLAWGELVNGRLGLQHLLDAAEKDDLAIIREFLAAHAGHNVDRMLDDAVKKITNARPTRDDEVIGDRRRLCISHLSRVFREARTWAAESRPADGTASRMVADLLAFANEIARDAVGIEELYRKHTVAHEYPAPLLGDLLTRFDPILKIVAL